MGKTAEWAKAHKPHIVTIVIVVVVAVCLIIWALVGRVSAQPPTAEVTVNVAADKGWTETSTPAIAHISGDGVDFYHAVEPSAEGNKGTSTVALAEGAYTVDFVSPVNADGSTYDTGEAQTLEVAVDEQADEVETAAGPVVECHMTLIPAKEVTDGALQAVVDQTRNAIAAGDETLKGDAGQAVLDKLEANVAASPNASKETKDSAAKVETEVDVDAAPAVTTPAANAGASGGTGGNNGNGSGSSGNGGGAASGGSSSGQVSASTHTHEWKDHKATKKVWVENWVTVNDYETKTIQGAQLYTEHSDGKWYSDGKTYWFEDGFTVDDFKAILKDKVKNEGYIGNYVNRTKTEKVKVGSHKEDQGHYKTKTYVDYQYCTICGEKR